MIKKLFNKINSYSFSAIIPVFIAIIIIICTNVFDDSDTYFIIENGKKIVTDGFPHIDWMSMHDGLHIIIQQWIPSVIIYLLNSFGGVTCNLFFFFLLWLAFFIFLFYATNRLSNKNYLLTILLITIAAPIIINQYGGVRPQTFSIFFNAIIVFLCQLYYSEKSRKILKWLPIISIIHANFHSTFWILDIGIMIIYYICDLIIYKKFNIRFTLAIIISILVGLINPYGYEALIQGFFTKNYIFYSIIEELLPIWKMSFIYWLLYYIPSFIATITLIIYFIVKKQVKWKYIPLLILLFISIIISIIWFRMVIYPILSIIFLYSVVFRSKQKNKKPISMNFLWKLIIVIITAFMFCTAIFKVTELFNRKIANYYGLTDAKNYLQETQPSEELSNSNIFITNINEGQYLYHYLNIHPYIDGRIETYIDSLNHKEDITTEFYWNRYYPDNFNNFLEKYKFDYLLLSKSSNLSNFVINDKEQINITSAIAPTEFWDEAIQNPNNYNTNYEFLAKFDSVNEKNSYYLFKRKK